jgi:hypothetical protein
VPRNQRNSITIKLLDALKLLPAERVILDSEIAAFDEKAQSSFGPSPTVQKLRATQKRQEVCWCYHHPQRSY